MDKTRRSRGEIAQEFLRGRNCAQCVLGTYAGDLGYEEEETDRMAACFGGGMELGQTCGAVTGALMAIGLACEEKERAAACAAAFRREFERRHGSCMCRDLLGCDLSKPDQAAQARASGKLLDACPAFVESAVELLDDLLDD